MGYRLRTTLLLFTLGLGGCQSTDFEYVPQETPVIPGSGREDFNGGVFGVAHRFGAPTKKKKKPKQDVPVPRDPRY